MIVRKRRPDGRWLGEDSGGTLTRCVRSAHDWGPHGIFFGKSPLQTRWSAVTHALRARAGDGFCVTKVAAHVQSVELQSTVDGVLALVHGTQAMARRSGQC